MIPFVISMLVLLLGVYYVTIFLYFMGVKIFGKVNVHVGLSLIPFFYWFKKEKKVVKKASVKKKKVKKKNQLKKLKKNKLFKNFVTY